MDEIESSEEFNKSDSSISNEEWEIKKYKELTEWDNKKKIEEKEKRIRYYKTKVKKGKKQICGVGS